MSDALEFLTSTLFTLIACIFILRLMLVSVQFNWQLHPIVEHLDRYTGLLINPLKGFIPTIKNIEYASLVVVFVAVALRIMLVTLLKGLSLSPVALLAFTLTGTLRLILRAYFYAVLAQAIVTYVRIEGPVNTTLTALVEPLLSPLRRFMPSLGSIDITPLPVLIILQVFIMLLP